MVFSAGPKIGVVCIISTIKVEWATFAMRLMELINASVIICHLSIGITAETIIKQIITNSLNLVHT